MADLGDGPAGELERAKTVMDMFDLAGASVKPVVARLVSRKGGEAIEVCEGDTVLKIGRAKTLPVSQRIDHMRLSSFHCELHLVPATLEIFLVDTSTNGTFLNGKRLEKDKRVALQAGDVISLLNSAAAADGTASSTSGEAEFLFQRLKSNVKQETLTEELTCSICRCIFHRPCSVVPCLHVFCAHCISSCLELNHLCPECRNPIDEVRPTHKINNLVDQLLKVRPELAPSKEEIIEFEKGNKIPPTGKRITKRPREEADDSDDDEYSDSDENSDSGSDGGGAHPPAHHFGKHGFGFGGAMGAVFHHFVPGFVPPPAPRMCPQCTTPAAGDGFLCPPGGPHLKCFSCKTPFPDRPLCGTPQKCLLCSMPFCDLYLGGCAASGGVGYLQPIKDHQMTALPLRLFGGNTIEQGVLSTHLATVGTSVADAWKECLKEFAANAWIPDLASVHGPLVCETVVCRPCCQRVFAALLYHYRRAIPREALPAAVTNRPNCWYGKDCRTQFNNIAHAQNYNHACPQEKRKE